MNINPLDFPGTPFVVELLNPNPTSNKRGYRISFQVSEEVHSSFMAAREGNLRIVARMAVVGDTDEQAAYKAVNGTQDMDKPEKTQPRPKAKEPKGSWSYFWEYLHPDGRNGGSGFATLPGVRESIEGLRITETEPTWELLHRVFGVGGGTLAETGPKEIYALFPPNEYPAVKIAVERAENYQREKEAKNVNSNSNGDGS